MVVVSLTALKKSNLLYVSSTQFARTFKGNPLLYFKFEDLKDFPIVLSSNATKFQIFGPTKDSDSVSC